MSYSTAQVAILEKVAAIGGRYAARADELLREAGLRATEPVLDPVIQLALKNARPPTEAERYFEAKREQRERLALMTPWQLMKQRRKFLKALRPRRAQEVRR